MGTSVINPFSQRSITVGGTTFVKVCREASIKLGLSYDSGRNQFVPSLTSTSGAIVVARSEPVRAARVVNPETGRLISTINGVFDDLIRRGFVYNVASNQLVRTVTVPVVDRTPVRWEVMLSPTDRRQLSGIEWGYFDAYAEYDSILRTHSVKMLGFVENRIQRCQQASTTNILIEPFKPCLLRMLDGVESGKRIPIRLYCHRDATTMHVWAGLPHEIAIPTVTHPLMIQSSVVDDLIEF